MKTSFRRERDPRRAQRGVRSEIISGGAIPDSIPSRFAESRSHLDF